DRHARPELGTRAGLAVVQHLWVLVELPTDAVPAVFADDGEALLLYKALDRVADVADPGAGADLADAAPHRLEADAAQPLADHGRPPYLEHSNGVPVEPVLDHGNVDVHDVAASEPLVA